MEMTKLDEYEKAYEAYQSRCYALQDRIIAAAKQLGLYYEHYDKDETVWALVISPGKDYIAFECWDKWKPGTEHEVCCMESSGNYVAGDKEYYGFGEDADVEFIADYLTEV